MAVRAKLYEIDKVGAIKANRGTFDFVSMPAKGDHIPLGQWVGVDIMEVSHVEHSPCPVPPHASSHEPRAIIFAVLLRNEEE